MRLYERTGPKQHIHKYTVLQCSKVFYFKVSSEFLGQDSQSTYSFGKIQNTGGPEFSEEKIQCFIADRFHILNLLYPLYYILLYYIIFIILSFIIFIDFILGSR